MIIPEEILAQIREIKDIFKNLNQSLLLDTFIYDENEYNIVKKIKNSNIIRGSKFYFRIRNLEKSIFKRNWFTF